ncbi:unnamed protein product [Adineta ricciae]|uniref:Uncharacterized protein n=1 Tax=Adineta ricciae TaxID=249248 RepID=A0A815WAB0_ADIRI|nr:unnamed protein product [Adineta ricciae]CAF1558066.1 unnamed protein product [Adineta ricciae]
MIFAIIIIIVILTLAIIIPVIIKHKQSKKVKEALLTTTTTTTTTTAAGVVLWCNITSCRAQIQEYIALNLTYDTVNLAKCNNCSRASFPSFPSDWSSRWYIVDYFIISSESADCDGNPYIGDLQFCQQACLKYITCIGFSRSKQYLDMDSRGICYLKKNNTGELIYNDETWHTIAFNSTT